MSDFDFDLDAEQSSVDPAPEKTVEYAEEVVAAPDAPSEVKLQFDDEYETDEKELTVSVAGVGPITVKTDGTAFTVPAEDAALLVQSPVVKEAN